MKELHAGYISSCVWQNIRTLSDDIDWLHVLNSLSSFMVDCDLGGESDWTPESSVLNNIICRGLPTLPSIGIEKFLERETGLTSVCESGDAGNTGQVVVSFKEDVFEEIKQRQIIEDALCFSADNVSLEFTPGFELPDDQDVDNELDFLKGPMQNYFGRAVQLFKRQGKFENIAGIQEEDAIARNRVDFALKLPCNNHNNLKGVVFELDGKEHDDPDRIIRDEDRRRIAQNNGWKTIVRSNNDTKSNIPCCPQENQAAQILNHPFIRRTNDSINTELGQKTRCLVLIPFAIARIQKVMIEAIRGNVLSCDAEKWRIGVLEHDFSCGKIALDDFQEWLTHVWKLSGKSTPVIEPVILNDANGFTCQQTTRLDLLIDVSVLIRYGTNDMNPVAEKAFYSVDPKKRVRIRSNYFRTEPRKISFGRPLKFVLGSDFDDNLRFFLQNIFRKTDFRDCQIDIIKTIIQNESVIALLPTGAGKSLTYQLSLMLQNGMVGVIDPIKSLMKDQVDSLRKLGIDCVGFINSNQTATERREVQDRMIAGELKFIFVSPERLLIDEFRDSLNALVDNEVYFCCGVVDEAHCVSEWGHDFRTAYLRTGENLRQKCHGAEQNICVAGLTGTASFDVMDDVERELKSHGAAVVRIKPNKMERQELEFHVDDMPNLPPNAPNENRYRQNLAAAKIAKLYNEVFPAIATTFGYGDFLQLLANDSAGIVFCPHITGAFGVETVANEVMAQIPELAGHIGKFHSRMSAEEQTSVQEEFIEGRRNLLFCTKGFGMGIDKPNIRFTVHFNIPQSLEALYQEAGRAGRDRKKAVCHILFADDAEHRGNEYSTDWQTMHSFHTQSFAGVQRDIQHIVDLLTTNVMAHSNLQKLQAYVQDEFGADISLNRWSPDGDGGPRRLYVNDQSCDPDVGYLQFNAAQVHVNSEANYTEHDPSHILNKVRERIEEKVAEAGQSPWEYIAHEAVEYEDGLEHVLDNIADGDEQAFTIPFKNGLAEEMANHLQAHNDPRWTAQIIKKAFFYAKTAEDFKNALGYRFWRENGANPVFDANDETISHYFKHIRLKDQTDKAVSRLWRLGVFSDYTVDYLSQTYTVKLLLREDGYHFRQLQNYIEKYVSPRDANTIMERVRNLSNDDCTTELRKCIRGLVKFTYDRIADRRLEALNTVERTVQAGIDDPDSFKEHVNMYFDSKYITEMREFLDDFELADIFEFIRRTRGEKSDVSHLLGSCDRLLNDNPNHPLLHSLRTFCYAMTPAYARAFAEECRLTNELLAKRFNWQRTQQSEFVAELLNTVRQMDPAAEIRFKHFFLNWHLEWLKDFNSINNQQQKD